LKGHGESQMKSEMKYFLKRHLPFVPFGRILTFYRFAKYRFHMRFNTRVFGKYRYSNRIQIPDLNPRQHQELLGIFSQDHYSKVTGIHFNSEKTALGHYLNIGEKKGYSPNFCFDPSYYLTNLKKMNVQDSEINQPLLIDFILKGNLRGIDPHPLFNITYYLTSNPDVEKSGVNGLWHYLNWGYRELRNPNPNFSVWEYTRLFPKDSNLNPLENFINRRTDAFIADTKNDYIEESILQLEKFIYSGKNLDFRSSFRPQVTVVIPVWNKAHFTLNALLALVEMKDLIKVVVIDNGSSDYTSAVLDRVIGIEIVSNPSNLGFVLATNQGIARSNTKFTLFMNNDCQFDRESLVQALRNFDNPTIGGVVAKVVLPNGLLQEAGSFLDRNCSAQGYLRGELPTCDLANIRREVDFGSGLFLLMPTSLLQSVGGLDEEFAPAYGEEVDLCIRIKLQGKSIVYDPKVTVSHFEFGSSEKPQSAIELQIKHQRILVSRYADLMAERPVFDGFNGNLLAFWNWRFSDKFVILDDRPPLEDEGAGSPRMASILEKIPRNVKDVSQPIFISSDKSFPPARFETADNLFNEIHFVRSIGMKHLLKLLEETSQSKLTLWVSRYHNLKKVMECFETNHVLRERFTIIYDSEAIVAVREASSVKSSLLNQRYLQSELDREMSLAGQADLVIAVSEKERDIFTARQKSPVVTLGHALHTRIVQKGMNERKDLLFVGRLTEVDSPNTTGLKWFIRKVLPEVNQRLGCKLFIIGQISPQVESILSKENTVVLGSIPDLSFLFENTRVFIAPTFRGAGIPHKIHLASSNGLPTVTTPLMVSLLNWENRGIVSEAETVDEFVASIQDVYTNEETWSSLSQRAVLQVIEECNPEAFAFKLRNIFVMLENLKTYSS
jgi:O-antigen biosynthesis protein